MSEVATMESLRLHGLLIPKVFGWSASAANAVGSEYIIMEHVQGPELSESWYTMTFDERMAIVKKIADFERLLSSILFPASGSIFYKEFQDPLLKRVEIPENPRFCIGPSTEYLWCYKKT